MRSALARAVLLAAVFAGGCARVHVRRAALEQLAATVAAGLAAHSGQPTRSAIPAQAADQTRPGFFPRAKFINVG